MRLSAPCALGGESKDHVHNCSDGDTHRDDNIACAALRARPMPVFTRAKPDARHGNHEDQKPRTVALPTHRKGKHSG